MPQNMLNYALKRITVFGHLLAFLTIRIEIDLFLNIYSLSSATFQKIFAVLMSGKSSHQSASQSWCNFVTH